MKNIETIIKEKITNIGFALSLIIFFLAMNFSDNRTGNWIHQKFDSTFYGNLIADVCFVDSVTGYGVTPYTGPNVTQYIIKTTNAGYNWNIIRTDSQYGSGFARIIFLNKDTGYVCGQKGLEKTTNGGMNWINIQLPSGSHPDEMFVLNEDTIWYVIANNLFGGLWRTTNGGINWVQQWPSGTTNYPYKIYMYNGTTGFLSTTNLYKTTNSGFNWTYITNFGFDDIVMIDSLIGYAAVGYYVDSMIYKTTDGGITWFGQETPVVPNVFMNYRYVKDLFAFNKDTVWGVYGSVQFINNLYRYKAVLYKTTNGGLNWGYQIPDTNFNIPSCRFVNFYNIQTGWCTPGITNRGALYTENGGDTTIYTGILSNNFIFPDNYILEQNYPNPFNSITNIKFKLKSGMPDFSLNSGFAEIKVYDITGKLIRVLTGKKYEPGEHTVRFDASELPSGVYFYKLEISGDNGKIYSETRKMILVK